MVPLNACEFVSYALNMISTQSVSDVRNELETLLQYGHCKGNYGSFYNVYGFFKQGYVIKIIKEDNLPETYYHKSPPKTSLIAPFFLYPIHVTKKESIIIQPLADTRFKRQTAAFRMLLHKIRDRLKEGQLIEDVWPDAHEGNVGLYNKQPVIIDFSHDFLE
jgi:hypothetical protein